MTEAQRNVVLALWLVLSVVGCTTPTASPAPAADGPTDRATLKGLTGVSVTVEPFSEQAKRAGFDERSFQTDAELKLRVAGIHVLSETEMLKTPGMPNLFLVVNPLHERRGERAAFSGRIELKQFVRLKRDQSIGTDAATWSNAWVGVGDLPFIREGAKGYVDRFIDAWLSVNPKQPESAP